MSATNVLWRLPSTDKKIGRPQTTSTLNTTGECQGQWESGRLPSASPNGRERGRERAGPAARKAGRPDHWNGSVRGNFIGEIEKWFYLRTPSAGEWFGTDVDLVGENPAAKMANKKVLKRIDSHANRRSGGAGCRGGVKARRSSRCRVAAECSSSRQSEEAQVVRGHEQEDVRVGCDMLEHPEECVAEMHCLDLTRKLSAIQRAGCEHGCATDVKVVDAVAGKHAAAGKDCKERCANKARTVLGTVVVPSDLDEWVQSCACSCQAVAPGRPDHVQWRQQQRGDKVMVSVEKEEVLNLDDLPLPDGEGWRCNETERWKPCLDTCDRFERVQEVDEAGKGSATRAAKERNGLRRSGCIYGCRGALARNRIVR